MTTLYKKVGRRYKPVAEHEHTRPHRADQAAAVPLHPPTEGVLKMTIDINKLRRLTQAATPGPWVNYGRQPSAAGLPYSAVAAKTLLVRVYSEAYGDFEQETANAEFIAAANPAAVSELLDRLEAAEKERDALRNEIAFVKEVEFPRKAQAVADAWKGKCKRLEVEHDALRAKITEMEQQEPVAWADAFGEPFRQKSEIDGVASPLYALPGAQAQNVPKAVAYLDIGAGGYMDIGTDLTDEELATLPNGRHMLGIVGTYGVDGYVPAQPAPIEMSITTGALSEMFLRLDGHDKAQPGYEWRKGWNDAIRQAMDYAQPTPIVPDLLEALKDMVNLVELMCPFEGPQQRKARAAIARVTGEQP